MARPTERSTLSVLTRARLFELAATAGQELPRSLAKAELVEAIAALPLGFDELLGALKRDELKEMCRAHGLEDGGREKAPLVARLVAAMTDTPASAPAAQAPPPRAPLAVPQLPLDVAPSHAERTIPTARSVLGSLTQERLVEVGRLFGVPIDLKTPRPRILDLLVTAARTTLADVLGTLTRDELRAACRAHELDHVERAREVLVARLLQAAGEAPVAAEPSPNTHGVPRVGDIVRCRKRGYLVEDVIPPPGRREATLVKLVCLDDDAPGRPLEVLWELELGAQVIRPETSRASTTRTTSPPISTQSAGAASPLPTPAIHRRRRRRIRLAATCPREVIGAAPHRR